MEPRIPAIKMQLLPAGKKVEWLAETFEKQIPVDGIVLDADYQQDYQPFVPISACFPDMPGLSAKLANMNIELTASVYPGVRFDSTYESYTTMVGEEICSLIPTDKTFKQKLLAGKCCCPIIPTKTRTWWANKMKWMQANGIHGYWNDSGMNPVAGQLPAG